MVEVDKLSLQKNNATKKNLWCSQLVLRSELLNATSSHSNLFWSHLNVSPLFYPTALTPTAIHFWKSFPEDFNETSTEKYHCISF